MTQPWQTHDDNTSPAQPGGQDIPVVETSQERPKPRGNNAFVLLLVVFCAALAVIYVIGMRKPKSAAASDMETVKKFDSALAALAQRSGKGDLNKNTNADQIVQMFYNAPKPSRIKAEDLPGNPFDMELPDATETSSNSKMTKGGGLLPAASKPVAKNEKNDFRLQSIIVTRQMPTAMINNRLCTVGSRIQDWEITHIDANRVVLNNNGHTLELTMDRPTLNGGSEE